MAKVLLVDMDKCTGCKQCSLACSLTKEDLFDPKRGRIKILKKEVIALGIPLLCEQCDTYPCIDSCPEGALTRNETTGIITVNEELCTECGTCVDACTYHAIRLHPETGKALICDLCGGDPYCVQHCVPGALEWVDRTDDTVNKKKKLRSARMAMYRELKKEAA
ncbi:MAG: 4Fe-4S dicluster domain-containing protein [Candidatus Thorarchaeota archaeon]|nr:4Fe-4S dicluster domain-containing protein [Candidatus Thorarchaeota archaeon]